MIVIWLKWHEPDLKPRSPMLILFLLGFLLLDCIGNTVLFSIDPNEYPQLVCWLGIFITVICEFGIMLVLYLRMYRINKVFTEYETYLQTQKKTILINTSVKLPKLSLLSSENNRPPVESRSPVIKGKHQSQNIEIQTKMFDGHLRRNSMDNSSKNSLKEANSETNSFLTNSARLVSSIIDSGVGYSASSIDEPSGI